MKKVSILLIAGILLAAMPACRTNGPELPSENQSITGDVSQLSPLGAMLSGKALTTTGTMEGMKAGIWRSKPQTRASYSDWKEDYIEATEFADDFSYSVYSGKLESNTKYIFKSYLFDGETYYFGEEVTFTTPDLRPVEALPVTDLTGSGVTLHAKINLTQTDFDFSTSPASYGFYGWDSQDRYFSTESKSTIPDDGLVSATLTGLAPGTYRCYAQVRLNDWDFTSYPETTFTIPEK